MDILSESSHLTASKALLMLMFSPHIDPLTPCYLDERNSSISAPHILICDKICLLKVLKLNMSIQLCLLPLVLLCKPNFITTHIV